MKRTERALLLAAGHDGSMAGWATARDVRRCGKVAGYPPFKHPPFRPCTRTRPSESPDSRPLGPQYPGCHFQAPFYEEGSGHRRPQPKPRGENIADTYIYCIHNLLYGSRSISMLPLSFFHPLSVQQVRQQKLGCRPLESAKSRNACTSTAIRYHGVSSLNPRTPPYTITPFAAGNVLPDNPLLEA